MSGAARDSEADRDYSPGRPIDQPVAGSKAHFAALAQTSTETVTRPAGRWALSVMAITQLEAVSRESPERIRLTSTPCGRRRLRVGPGWGVRVFETGLCPAFPVLFLLAEHLPHQGIFAGVVHLARLIVRLIAGAARHWWPLTHIRPSSRPGCALSTAHTIVQPHGGEVPVIADRRMVPACRVPGSAAGGTSVPGTTTCCGRESTGPWGI